ncbi:MAG: sulfatase [Bacteroidetes bacterium]|nr:sulfatase [Bacteroidota bacterium]
MKIKIFLPILLFTISTIGIAQKNSTPKNILFIAVDDLKPMLNVYGENQMHTPNFDRLAEMGVIFENAHVQQAVCGPSRASIMTGMYPDGTKVWDLHTNFRESAPELLSMPEYLITQGYETTATGKIYHQGSTSGGHDAKSWSLPYIKPTNFDPMYGEPAFGAYQNPDTKEQFLALEKEAIAKGIKKPGQQRAYVKNKLRPSTESANVSDEAYNPGLYTIQTLKNIETLQKTGKPFFVAVGYQKPHLPFVAPKKYWDLYKRDEIALAEFQELSKGTPDIAYHSFGELRAFSDIDNNLGVGDRIEEDKQRELVHGYMACISYIDAQIGKLLDALEEKNLLNNTVIVLWGDHGYHLGDHTLWNKHSNFEQATRIPLMFAGPGVEKNVKVKNPVELVDVFPTLFDLAGVKIPNLDGKSLVPLLDNNDKTTIDVDYAISQYRRHKEKMGYSLRTERYRYTEWHDEGYRSYKSYEESTIVARELYDYEVDPLETKNLVNDANYASIVNQLKAKLTNHLQQ